MSMLRIVEIFQQKGTDKKTLLIVSCSIYSFLIWISETNQTVFFKIRSDIWMLQIVEIFQHFSKIFTQLKIFLAPHQSFLFFYLAPKEFSFLNKTNSCSCPNWLKYYIKILTLILPAALLSAAYVCSIVSQWRRKKLILIKNISTDWRYQTFWSKWLKCLDLRALTMSLKVKFKFYRLLLITFFVKV